jgi:hypothetical protein
MPTSNDLIEDEEALVAVPDEVAGILAALTALIAGASSPVVRACLEEAQDDIDHLAGTAGGGAVESGEADAA